MELKIKIHDFVRRDRHVNQKTGRLERLAYFPEFVCDDRGRYKGIVHPDTGEYIECPYEAYILALIKYGYENLENTQKMLPGKRFSPPEEGPAWNLPRPGSLVDACKPRASWQHFCFPTLIVSNRGYKAIDGDIYLPCYIISMSAGYSLRHWDNELYDIVPDDSADRLSILQDALKDMPKTTLDTGWSLNQRVSNPRRGYRDYNRRVNFESPPSESQLELFREMLSLDNCPGWNVGVAYNGGTSYTFRTILDSSD